MPKAYVIARVTVTDPQAYAEYAKDATEAIRKCGGRPLARGGTFEALEGEARSRNVILEFEILRAGETLLSHSAEYQAKKAKRAGAAVGEFVVVEGVMAKGYWIGRVDVTNPDAYQAYVRGNRPVFARYGARFPRSRRTVRGGRGRGARQHRARVPELSAGARLLARPGLQAVKRLRDGHCIADILVIEGYEGPQPSLSLSELGPERSEPR